MNSYSMTLKSIQGIVFGLILAPIAFAQTNTFPSSGLVGVGTTNPVHHIHVQESNSAILKLEALDGGGAPASTAFIHLRGYENRGKGVFITDSNSTFEFFMGDAYDAHGISLGVDTTANSKSEYAQNSALFVDTAKNVGIGTTSPGSKLDVDNGFIRLDQDYGIQFSRSYPNDHGRIYVDTADGTIMRYHAYYGHRFSTYSGDKLWISQSGNVGIGAASTGNKLEVAGTIRSKEVIVESTGWPDYVFEDGYDLPSLAEVESHIEEKGHLPGVEPASAVNEGGQSLGAMQRQMMQKIEELTLYMIEKDKEMTALQSELSEVKKRLDQYVE